MSISLNSPPNVIGGNSEKLPNDKLLELLKFRIPLKWRNQLHLQNFNVQEHTIKEFTVMYEWLESTFCDLPSSEPSNKGSSNKNKSRGNKKRRRNNNSDRNDRENIFSVFCMAKMPLTIQMIVQP